jgi:hypothetical protein
LSLLPEFIFRAVLTRGIATIRNDTRYLDQLFRNLDQESAAEMRQFFQKQLIFIDVNYPRETLKLPAIIILLRSENEEQAFMGDSMGVDQVPDALSYDDHEEIEVLGGVASVTEMSGQGPMLYGPDTAASGTLNTLRVPNNEWEIDQFMTEPGRTVGILQGTGVGQQRRLVGNSQNTLMVEPNWQIVPDATTVFEVRGSSTEVIGEPRAIYPRSEGPKIERLGALYSISYQMQIIGGNAELVIYLHAIVKAIFTLSRTFMEGQGIINFKMGATDFIPKPDYLPDLAYMRAVNADFLYPFDVFTELGGLANELRIVLEEMTEFKPVPPEEKVILSDTTTDIDPA